MLIPTLLTISWLCLPLVFALYAPAGSGGYLERLGHSMATCYPIIGYFFVKLERQMHREAANASKNVVNIINSLASKQAGESKTVASTSKVDFEYDLGPRGDGRQYARVVVEVSPREPGAGNAVDCVPGLDLPADMLSAALEGMGDELMRLVDVQARLMDAKYIEGASSPASFLRCARLATQTAISGPSA